MTVAECPLEEWRQIVAVAVTEAKQGNPRARDFLAQYLLGRPGEETHRLHQLAVEEEAGLDPVSKEAMMARLLDV